MSHSVKIDISNGELLDKLSILEIKLKHIKDDNKLLNIQKEYDTLVQFATNLLTNDAITEQYTKLQNINAKLWNIENYIRIKEHNKQFDNEFIELARSVYITNDQRAEIKRHINMLTGSVFIEEKSYEQYS